MKRFLLSLFLCSCCLLAAFGQEGYPAIDNDYVPTTYKIDTRNEAGQIDITSGVSPTGARTYTVPISAYKGIRGFNPELSLVYNSQQGNGLLGVGWSLSGLSVICRTVQTPYYDGKIAPIAFNREDVFMLDGMRLVQVDSVTYLSERGYIRVKANYAGNSLRYFDVAFPNGRTAIFGYKTNTANNLYYPLTELSDLWGNTITYHYTSQENHYRISKITYNGASIEFSFAGSRTDPVSFYLSGQKVTVSSLLKTITCKFGNTVLGTYKLNYRNGNQTPLKQSLLEEVKYMSGVESFPPLHFYYGEGNKATGYDTHSFVCTGYAGTSSPKRFVIARNTDHGKADLIVEVPDYDPYIIQNELEVVNGYEGYSWIENGYPSGDAVNYFSSMGETQAGRFYLTPSGGGFIDILAADITGCGRDCVVQINNTIANKEADCVTFRIYDSESLFMHKSPQQHTYNFPTLHSSVYGNVEALSIQPKYYYPGDFNGDGKVEILGVSAHQPFGDAGLPSQCYMFDLQKGTLLYQGHIFPFHVEFRTTWNSPTPDFIYNRTDKIFVLDYDGDGCSEFIHQNRNGAHIYKFDIKGSVWTPRKIADGHLLVFTDNTKFLTGDLNGDGLTDILRYVTRTSNRKYCELYISQGNGVFDVSKLDLPLHEGESLGQERRYNFLLQDVNGDGRSDLIDYADKGFYTYFYDNSGRFEDPFFTQYPSSGGQLLPSRQKMKGDFSKLAYVNGNDIHLYSFSRNDKKESLVTGMVNSLGVIEKNDYAIVNGDATFSSVYIQGSQTSHPYVEAFDNLPLLSISEKYVDGKQMDGWHYYYEGGVKHLTGKGFCGFRQTRTVDFKGKELVRDFDPERHGIMTHEVYDLAYENYYEYGIVEHPNRMAEVNLYIKDERDYLRNAYNLYYYDGHQFGYPSTVEIEYGDGHKTKTNTVFKPVYTGWAKNKAGHMSPDSMDVCRMLAYLPSGQEYLFGRIHEQTVTNTTAGGKSVSQRTAIPSWQYDRPTARRDYLGVETRYDNQYDEKGNLIKAVTEWAGQARISESWEYDDYGSMSSHTSEIGTTEKYAYGTDGRLKSHTDSRGNATAYTYDGLGRQAGIEHADGTTVAYEYAWCDEGPGGVYAVTTRETGKPDTKTVYDALGRVVRQSEMTFDGKWRNTDTEYDVYGRVARRSLPYTRSVPSHYTVYTYDDFDRLISVTDRPGHTTTYAYSDDDYGYTIITTQDGVKTTRAYDLRDRLVRVDDPGGTTRYELDADGQPLTITAPDGTQAKFEYDAMRKCRKRTDPGFGESTYAYEAFGGIAQERNARGENINRVYDAYNRLTNIGWGSPNVAYTYTPHGETATVKGFNDTFITYAYDGFGRLASYREDAPDGKWLLKDYTYKDGNAASVTYTSQGGKLATEFYTYQNGHLTEIRLDDGTSVFKLESENGLGKPTRVQTGNLTRLYEYDAYGYPLRRTGKTGQSTCQDFTYTFDTSRQNLRTRTDQRSGKTETFSYDGMNRLTGDGTSVLEYAANGNILKKSGVGSYTYGMPGKPHAVTGISPGGALTSGWGTQEVFYTKALRPDSLHEGAFEAKFVYNGHLDKVKMTVTQGQGRSYLRKYYLGGCYELEESSSGPARERLYLGGDYYDAPVMWEKTGPLAQCHSLLRDYLGSITHVVRFDGYLTNELSHDAWGARRSPTSHSPEARPSTLSAPAFSRGFCGHEHLGVFGLVDMGARLYDPVVGRFLSPDPHVQIPGFSQVLNRYTYCMNNPLVHVDENGETPLLVIGAAALIGGTANLGWKAIHGQIDDWGDAISAFRIGAAAGGFGAAAGFVAAPIAGAGFLGGFVEGAFSGVVSSSILSVGNSQAFGDPQMGWKGYVWSAIGAGVVGGVVNGGVAASQGRTFGRVLKKQSVTVT